MIKYKREIRLKDLEIYMIFKDNTSMGYLIIEDLRRPLSKEELKLFPYKYMDKEDIEEYRNVIKIDILSDEILNEDDQEVFKEFAMGLVDCKDFCALVLNVHVNKELFESLPLDNTPEDYQKILIEINSQYNISNLNLNNLLYLSQD